jgi:glucosamine-6-phosphate deaminase
MTGHIDSPHLIVCADDNAASRQVAEILARAIRAKPSIVLGLATGATPVDAYHELVHLHRQQGLDFSQLTSFNLDEYVGLPPDHPQSFRCFMQQHLFDHVNIQPARTHLPDGMAADLDCHTRDYEARIRAAGGIDLQLLGIGSNGHIAFNEPGSAADSRTRLVQLTEETIQANARFFASADQVPRLAITMGIGTILEARRIVLMATGPGKAEPVRRALEGPCDASHPASLLQRHRDLTVVLDEAAAALLSGR